MSQVLLRIQVDRFVCFCLLSSILIPIIARIKLLNHFHHSRENYQRKMNKKSETRNKKKKKARTYHYGPIDIGRMNPEGFLMFSEVMLPHRYCTKWYGTNGKTINVTRKPQLTRVSLHSSNGLSHQTKECGSSDPTTY